MGITTALIFQWVVFSENMNKFLAIACLAAVAVAKPEAEADPALLYGAYGYAGLGHLGYAGYPYAYGYAGYPLAAHGYASVSPSASTSIAGLAPAAVPALAGGYAGAGRYVANSAGVVHVAKREAEAEADPALLYGAFGYAGLGYGLGYAGYAGYPYAYGLHGYPYAHAAGYANVSPSASTSIAGLAPAAVPALAGGYAGAGRYVANSAGVVHVAKREAEAEADPAILYGGYGYAGLGYTGLGYAGYAGYPYAYGLGLHGYHAAGYANVSPSASTSIAGLAPAAVPALAGGYAGAGRYVANSAGVVHVA